MTELDVFPRKELTTDDHQFTTCLHIQIIIRKESPKPRCLVKDRRKKSIIKQRKIKKLVNTLCSDLEIKQVFTLFKIKSWFGAKDPIPAGLRSRVIYKFSCAGCSACYIGETNRHFATRIREHLASDKNSHIFKHLRGSENCRSLCSEDCFKILDSAPTSFQLKIKEAMHILWEHPSLNS